MATRRDAQTTGRRRERRAAAARKTRPQPGSGNTPGRPGDWIEPEWLVEHKSTERASYSLKLAEWDKVRTEAALMGRKPAMMINIRGVSLWVTSA